MIRPLPLASALTVAAVIGTVWPVSSAFSTGVMTPKQAALGGLVATRKAAEPPVGSLIVKLRNGKAQAQPGALSSERAQALSKAAGMGMKPLRTTAGGAHVLRLDAPLSVAEARVVAARLAQDPGVEYAEPNVRFRALALPNEPRFAQWQWNLFAPTTSYTGALGASSLTATAAGGASLPAAWDLATGSSDVIVAVIDTGITNHTDLNGVSGGATYAPSGRFLPGFDFVSAVNGAPTLPDNFVSNDGNGRDPDPSDPGDWITAGEKTLYPSDCAIGENAPYTASDSSWHGTHMAGVLAATANNAVGIAGVAWNVKIVPIRALGRCGGLLDDISDAVRWAAGLSVSGAPPNSNPAKVISLSLGGGNTCGPTMQAAVDAAMQAGAIVIAASGNDGNVGLIAPANCNGVLAVTAHTIIGENAEYANIADQALPKAEMLSAPGGGPPTSSVLSNGTATNNSNWDGYYIFSSVLFGTTGPLSSGAGGQIGPAYSGFVGTSPATPQVAGVAALLKSMVPDATPAQIRSFLLTNVRPYPAGSVCAAGGTFAGQCGTGLLDADRALMAAGPLASPTATAGDDRIVAPGAAVTLAGSARAYGGKTITAYQWTQTGGTPTVTLATPNAATTTFTAPATGALTFRLRVTDSAGKTGDDSVVVQVNSPPAVATVPAQAAASGSVVTFNVTGTDVDGNPLTFVAASGSTVPLSALAPSGAFNWNTTGVPAGTYQLVYFADDGLQQSAPQTVAITVTGSSTANPPSSGGGGALPLAWLLLAALLALPGVRQRQR